MDPPQRGEGGVVQAGSHTDAEQQPGDHHDGDRIGQTEQRQSRGQQQIGSRQYRPSTDQVDLPADTRAEQGCNHQRRRKGAKNPIRGDAEIARDRIGQDRRQIHARRPGQRLRGAERHDDGKLASAHGLDAIVIPWPKSSVSRLRRTSCFAFASATRQASTSDVAGPLQQLLEPSAAGDGKRNPRGGTGSERRPVLGHLQVIATCPVESNRANLPAAI